MPEHKKKELLGHLSSAFNILWEYHGNGYGTDKEKLISELQLEIENLSEDTRE